MQYTCPACGYLTFNNPPGSYDTCSVCGWEDDEGQLRFPSTLGANNVSLIQAQKNFARIGYSTYNILMRLLFKASPKKYKMDSTWRQLTERDNFEVKKPGLDYGDSYPEDLTKLYYWRIK
ncbi:MAG: hypothetical protein A3I07_02735 [Candidatus Doudnabacteria bacterium RIFCSPLOWO2_02_FULL_42_9]|uniref:Cysteine-rich CPCC domain-containing protein n=1 Tax=Candidatus Doudnabacteria bacterium RIFCSPHIGHO2_01_FULL_41_86 TaxID=1817821 RepID=A0A1F5N9U5_9BACT|nr:MAG: hypothetical protein A2717_02265 [Candidatus Doudnabacteria bacterium RIFCSPHIGHO2_01_FULL_41_86]OGE75586.1 MAG: hypothetical protein A3K07_02020 [Candidatus Doudnabacteria bacterium RIFCSPHIGHO2_01_43_10]OGE85382.1 MAG: hypothetical protein A3E28_01835 [Candidatus Doudnabacteria bacterium RIFCSPHIGHO2_12_FULL_42_22]OGE86920.1 MAG: hypothetical protein A3C49_02670 [Candidatus Doudnabacteria bacterium RIFCSPHIGHO2_02_FULL_42_25]OGE92519.1 MAG: hypothetical protein A2895_02825 [Candidatus